MKNTVSQSVCQSVRSKGHVSPALIFFMGRLVAHHMGEQELTIVNLTIIKASITSLTLHHLLHGVGQRECHGQRQALRNGHHCGEQGHVGVCARLTRARRVARACVGRPRSLPASSTQELAADCAEGQPTRPRKCRIKNLHVPYLYMKSQASPMMVMEYSRNCSGPFWLIFLASPPLVMISHLGGEERSTKLSAGGRPSPLVLVIYLGVYASQHSTSQASTSHRIA
jgi:hypothetical protein